MHNCARCSSTLGKSLQLYNVRIVGLWCISLCMRQLMLEPKGSAEIPEVTFDAPHARQPLVKGGRLAHYEVNAVMTTLAVGAN